MDRHSHKHKHAETGTETEDDEELTALHCAVRSLSHQQYEEERS